MMKFDTLFTNATVITMNDDEKVLKKVDVGVSSGIITYIKPHEEGLSANKVVDCTNKILMPGLINTHAHLAMMLLRGYADDLPLNTWLFEKVFPMEAKIDQKCVHIGTTLAIAEAIRTGTTSFTDNYFFSTEIAKVAVQTGVKMNIANMVTHFGEGPYDPTKDRAITEFRELMSSGHNYDNERIKVSAGIHAPYTSSQDAWSFVKDLALENRVGISVHISETQKETKDMFEKYGKTTTRLFKEAGVFDSRVTAAHCVDLTEDDIITMSNHSAVVSHCPVSNLKLASGIANVPLMLKHGLRVSLGTDGACSNNNMDLFEEIKLAAILHKGVNKDAEIVPAYEVLKMATVNGAFAQGREDRTGRIVEGFDADIILIDLDEMNMIPIYDVISAVVYAASGKDVCFNMVQGKVLYEDGKFNTIDIEKYKFMLYNYALPMLK